MNESALRTLLSSLEASRSSLHGRLHVFTFLVVVGLGFDLFVIIKEFWDDLKEFKYQQVHPYEAHLAKRPSISLLLLGLLGTVLIVIGVAGELHIDAEVAKVETDIRVASDALMGLIIQEAGDAKTSAKGAADAAGRAKTEADQVTGIATSAKSVANDAKDGATDAKRQVADLRTQTQGIQQRIDEEKERIARIETPRHLTDVDRVTKALGVFKGTEYLFSEVGQDPDSLRFLVEVDGVLQRAGWVRVAPPHGFPQIEMFGGHPEYGVNVSLSEGIDVSTESLNPPTAKERFSVTDPRIPANQRAAGLLRMIFSNELYPPEEHADQKQVTVGYGNSQTVRIAIGRKP